MTMTKAICTEAPKPEQFRQLRELWQLAFGDSPEFMEGFFATGFDPECCRCLTVGGGLAAALYWFNGECDGQKFAYLYAVATHPDYRGQGLCRSLMADTHGDLRSLGYDGALLYPADRALRQMYGKMGYRDCSRVSEVSGKAGEPVVIWKICREEYARLRRQYLPQGGVIQEGRNLAFLETFAAFYAGKDFLLAALPEGGCLHGIELLGNTQAAPGILAALGYGEGTFRIPGEEMPFAMFLPLSSDAQPPRYFGLPFD